MGMDALSNTGAVYQQTRVQPVTIDPAAVYVENSQSVQNVEPAKSSRHGSEGKDDFKGKASDDEIKQAIASANRRAHFGHASAEFSYHEPTKRISVKIIDKDTNEVIREIPPEETLEMISKMWELAGIMVDEKR